MELALAFAWERFGTPPRPGGMYDQPMALLRRITAALNTYDSMTAYRRQEATKDGLTSAWMESHKAVQATYERILGLRIEAMKHEQ